MLELSQQLVDEEAIAKDFVQYFDLMSCRHSISQSPHSESQVIWTDGACVNNQDARLRRAGSGIYYGPDDRLNWSGMLPGLAQSNQRAELFAVVVACLRDPRPLDVRSDSEWVCNGVKSLQSCPATHPREHSDLWNMLAAEFASRSTAVKVAWVKGHASNLDIVRGRTTAADKAGNDGADRLAVAGAASHQVPEDVAGAALSRRIQAKAVHQMMLAILCARRAEELEVNDEADRGSALGDFDVENDCIDEFEFGACTLSAECDPSLGVCMRPRDNIAPVHVCGHVCFASDGVVTGNEDVARVAPDTEGLLVHGVNMNSTLEDEHDWEPVTLSGEQ